MIFACSISAYRDHRAAATFEYKHTVRVFNAESGAEADAEAHLFALERWPESDGWRGHSEEVVPVTLGMEASK